MLDFNILYRRECMKDSNFNYGHGPKESPKNEQKIKSINQARQGLYKTNHQHPS